MSKCKHDSEYPIKLPNGNIHCPTCRTRLATTLAGSDYIGTDVEIVPVRRSNWSKESLTKALDQRGKPVYSNLDKLTGGNDLRDYDPEATTKDTVTSQQGATIEDKLRQAIVNYRIKCDMALSEKDDGFYTQEDYQKAIEWELNRVIAIITTETTRLGASEKQQCVCKDCGNQVVNRCGSSVGGEQRLSS